MRRLGVTLTLLAVLLVGPPATSPAGATGRTADLVPPHPPSPLAGLPADVANGQVVALAEGDRYEVTASPSGGSIRGRRWDAATGSWGARSVIFRDPRLRCWGLVARGSGDGVAVRIGCGPALNEGWDGHPYAIVSADTEQWQSRRLPGYGWKAPGISPDGERAVWARGDDFYTWSEATGFVRRVAAPPRRASEGEAPMVTDDGAVTIAYDDGSCSITLDTYRALAAPVRQVLPTAADCYATGVTAIDAHTVAFGDAADEWSNARVTRPDGVSPWVVSALAPLSAPGLLADRFLSGFAPMLLDAPDRPLAVVSNGRSDLRVQLYDPMVESWQDPTTLVTRPGGTRCRYLNDLTPYLGFHALSLRCAGPDRVVTSTGGDTWTALPMRARAVGPNAPLGLLAVPDRDRTVVVSSVSRTTVSVGTEGGCDLVVPVAPDRLLRLTAPEGGSGWPSVLQRSTPRGWRTVHRVRTPGAGRCTRVFPGRGGGPRFNLQGPTGHLRVLFVEVDGRWDVRVRR